MAKFEKKMQFNLEGIYNHDTRTVTVETKERVYEVNINDFLESIDGYEVKIAASNQMDIEE